MQSQASSRSQAGFTMIEVMIALLLAALAILGIVALFSTSAATSGDARHTTEATALAQDKIEWLRTQGPALAGGGTDTISPSGVTGTGMYTRTWQETLGTTSATIAVTVSWFDGGREHQVKLSAGRGL